MKLLLIDTTTEICSVALSNYNQIIAEKTATALNAHAAELTLLIQRIFAETNTTATDLAAVAISSGPGSYTGLRIGAATAKGLCFAADLPLISVSTLQALAAAAKIENAASLEIAVPTENTVYIPMIDVPGLHDRLVSENERLPGSPPRRALSGLLQSLRHDQLQAHHTCRLDHPRLRVVRHGR